MGIVPSTARRKKDEMISGGLLGSERKMWWISGSLPYRSGVSTATGAALLSCGIVNVKAGELYPDALVPMDARITEAVSEVLEARNWVGSSFWAYPRLMEVLVLNSCSAWMCSWRMPSRGLGLRGSQHSRSVSAYTRVLVLGQRASHASSNTAPPRYAQACVAGAVV